jgi:hypothetical protein
MMIAAGWHGLVGASALQHNMNIAFHDWRWDCSASAGVAAAQYRPGNPAALGLLAQCGRWQLRLMRLLRRWMAAAGDRNEALTGGA